MIVKFTVAKLNLLTLQHVLWSVAFTLHDNWDKESTVLVSKTRGCRKVRYSAQ